MSDLGLKVCVYMFVCVLRADADVSGFITAADETQLPRCHTRCSRLSCRSHEFAEKRS